MITPEKLIKETKESIELNVKKIEILDKDIEKIHQETQQKINKIVQKKNSIIEQIIKDQGGIEKLEKLINANNKVEFT